MSVLKSVLKEEAKRLKALSKMYKVEIKKLPKGSVSLKKIRNGHYAYLAFRKGKRVHFNYLGQAGSEPVQKMQAQIEERRKIQSLMKQASINLHEVQGMMRVRKA